MWEVYRSDLVMAYVPAPHIPEWVVKEMGVVVRSCVYPEGKFLQYLLIENEKMRKSIQNFA